MAMEQTHSAQGWYTDASHWHWGVAVYRALYQYWRAHVCSYCASLIDVHI
jgi:hypothetical protein